MHNSGSAEESSVTTVSRDKTYQIFHLVFQRIFISQVILNTDLRKIWAEDVDWIQLALKSVQWLELRSKGQW